MLRKRESRPVRKPMSDRAKLQIPDKYIEEGFVYRIVNDEPGRLDMFQEAGWEFVKRHDSEDHAGLGSTITYFTGVTQTNKEGQSYAMRIKKAWYNEDQLTLLTTQDSDKAEQMIEDYNFRKREVK